MTDERPPAAPAEVARSFVDAIVWGEHRRVWELLSDEGRRTVLRVAIASGMDEALAARLRDGTAARTEREEFLTDLVNGLRADLLGNDLDNLEYEVDELVEPGRARVQLSAPLHPGLGIGGLPAGSVDLVHDGERWRVERLTPVVTGT